MWLAAARLLAPGIANRTKFKVDLRRLKEEERHQP